MLEMNGEYQKDSLVILNNFSLPTAFFLVKALVSEYILAKFAI